MGCTKSKTKTIDSSRNIEISDNQDYEEKQEVSIMRADDEAIEVQPAKRQASNEKKLVQQRPEQKKPVNIQQPQVKTGSISKPIIEHTPADKEVEEDLINMALNQKLEFPNEKPDFDFEFLENQEDVGQETHQPGKEVLMDKLLEDISEIQQFRDK